MTEISVRDIKVICEDNYQLAATIFKPTQNIKGAVLIGPATGIKRQFYANFAQFLAKNGFAVLTYDNRGIGDSLYGSVKDSKASLQCWGQLDQPAALDELMKCFPKTHYHLVGHSAGGQLFGLLPNAKQLKSIFNYACSSGRLWNMRLSHQLKAHFFMNFFIPTSNALFGHTKAQWVGMGEPLPKQVAKQWQTWCNGSGYVKMAFNKSIEQHYYEELTTPSMWVNATDDDIANDANVQDMLKVCPKLSAQTLTLKPEDYDLTEIGHMKFFSRKSQALWKLPLEWLEKHSA
ncbi:alpha/beta fold hydrolase [Aliikangiella marina]|uniref:Alpha/beta fold hydrolase n=1 Tax=Aliikangiella marina TaxID=1712262 RepID=A0A545T4Q8_9GAMM|nr:alpha/beta fold hydrolase [Aliikangiella marina]TQV72203.1 alpha/beta fold hydrolase [Aliikangiella marina]